jgi:hypothetical protein
LDKLIIFEFLVDTERTEAGCDEYIRAGEGITEVLPPGRYGFGRPVFEGSNYVDDFACREYAFHCALVDERMDQRSVERIPHARVVGICQGLGTDVG